MFGKSAQKRIIRDIDKIVSLKEDLDALSWGRVHEIGRALSSGVDAKEQDALGAELMKIAQANMSMYSRMGVMPMTEHVVEHTHERTSAVEPEAVEHTSTVASPERRSTAVSADAVKATAEHAPELTHDQTPEQIVEEEIVLPSGMTVMEGGLVEAALEHPEQAEAPLTTETAQPLDQKTAEELGFALDEVEDFFGTGAPVFEFPASPVGGKVRIELTPVAEAKAASVPEQAAEPKQSAAPEAVVEPKQVSVPEPAAEPKQAAAQAAEQVIAQNATDEINKQVEKMSQAPLRRDSFGRFHHLYESRDGALCVFQDEMGHLVSVKSSRLA